MESKTTVRLALCALAGLLAGLLLLHGFVWLISILVLVVIYFAPRVVKYSGVWFYAVGCAIGGVIAAEQLWQGPALALALGLIFTILLHYSFKRREKKEA